MKPRRVWLKGANSTNHAVPRSMHVVALLLCMRCTVWLNPLLVSQICVSCYCDCAHISPGVHSCTFTHVQTAVSWSSQGRKNKSSFLQWTSSCTCLRLRQMNCHADPIGPCWVSKRWTVSVAEKPGDSLARMTSPTQVTFMEITPARASVRRRIKLLFMPINPSRQICCLNVSFGCRLNIRPVKVTSWGRAGGKCSRVGG